MLKKKKHEKNSSLRELIMETHLNYLALERRRTGVVTCAT